MYSFLAVFLIVTIRFKIKLYIGGDSKKNSMQVFIGNYAFLLFCILCTLSYSKKKTCRIMAGLYHTYEKKHMLYDMFDWNIGFTYFYTHTPVSVCKWL